MTETAAGRHATAELSTFFRKRKVTRDQSNSSGILLGDCVHLVRIGACRGAWAQKPYQRPKLPRSADHSRTRIREDGGRRRRRASRRPPDTRGRALNGWELQGALDAWASISPQSPRDAVPATPSAADLEFVASTLKGYSSASAIDAIVRAAKDRQIVILNEAHHVARHRAFATLVALELRKVGFKYLAIKTLTADSNAVGLMQRRYPKFGDEDGWYSCEPVFGDFLRRAMSAGYRLVAYERSSRGMNAPQDAYSRVDSREEKTQANNLARVLAQDPKARMLVYVGYGHAYKGMLDVERKPVAMMAQRLRARPASTRCPSIRLTTSNPIVGRAIACSSTRYSIRARTSR